MQGNLSMQGRGSQLDTDTDGSGLLGQHSMPFRTGVKGVEVKVGGGWCAERGSQRKRNENEIKKRNFYNFRTKISATHWQDTCVLVASFTLLPRPQRATSWAYVSKFSALLVCGFLLQLCSAPLFVFAVCWPRKVRLWPSSREYWRRVTDESKPQSTAMTFISILGAKTEIF